MQKSNETWAEYASRMYHTIYKHKGYTFAETLKAIGSGKSAKSKKAKKSKLMKRRVGGDDDGSIFNDMGSVITSGIKNQFLNHPFDSLSHPALSAIQGATDGIKAQTYYRTNAKANDLKNAITNKIGNNFVSNVLNSAIDSGVSGVEGLADSAFDKVKQLASGRKKKPVRKVGGVGKSDMKWVDFVKSYHQKNPHLTYGECMAKCSPIYQKGKELVGSGVIDSINDFLFKHLSKLVRAVGNAALDRARERRIDREGIRF